MRRNFLARMVCLGTLLLAPSVALAEAGWNAGVEYLLLAPKVNSTGFEMLFYEGVDFDTVETEGDYNNKLEGGVRLTGGYETCCGFGAQVRYFSYDNDIGYQGLWNAGTTIPVFGQNTIDVDALDIEVTQRGEFKSWDVVATGGLRYGSVDITQPTNFFSGIPAVIFGGPTGVDFTGVGPVVSLSAQRPLGYGLSIFGRARMAMLFGDVEVTPAFQSGGTFTVQDEFAQVWEMQFGLQMNHDFNGHNVFGGVFWEAQRWDSDSNFIGDLGLHGLGLSAGCTY